MAQSMVRSDTGSEQGIWSFYDANLVLLKQNIQPLYRFDPRGRPWFGGAIGTDQQVLSEPYVFFTTREVGITLSQKSRQGQAVIGLDVALPDLGREVAQLRRTPNSEIAVIDSSGRVMAYSDMNKALVRDGDQVRFQTLEGLGVPALVQLVKMAPPPEQSITYPINGHDWFGMRMMLDGVPGHPMQILFAVPDTDLLGTLRESLRTQALFASLLILALLPFGWMAGRQVGLSLTRLTRQAQQLTRFNFQQGEAGRSVVREVKELDVVFGNMCLTMQNFLRTTEVISSEPKLDTMLQGVLQKLVETTHCYSGAVYLFDDRRHRYMLAGVAVDPQSAPGNDQPFDANLPADFQSNDFSTPGVMVLALTGRQEQSLGLLVLHHKADDEHQSEDFRAFALKLSGALSVSVETRNLFAGQQRLFEGVIQLLADAIDAKSPYTGGHCERVPELAEMLVDRLRSETQGPYASFTMNDIERYEFRLGAWLHDCGKVTSPEYIIDKATKLETIYNRIHEIRTRFEVLWRDAHIHCLEQIAQGADASAMHQWLEQRQRALHDDFAFLAICNIGSEHMGEDDVARIERIGAQTWWRHFDNRLGLSSAELQRMPMPAAALPVMETLLGDRPEHAIAWGARRPPVEPGDPHNLWGFSMKLPPFALNLGELHNLTIRRGTLTPEERFKVNEHIVQTYIMLRSLPWPGHLLRVPEIAATHHERLDGKGYPRGLSSDRLTLPDRVMALADVFEALTASDRPYKAPKTLSESLQIMVSMANERHLDADLLRYFLRSRLWELFARRYLSPAQIDHVDIAALERSLRD
jgi:HD-GYP domain-containing protein (c-di-GMP phosphodiesterase class II)